MNKNQKEGTQNKHNKDNMENRGVHSNKGTCVYVCVGAGSFVCKSRPLCVHGRRTKMHQEAEQK